MGEQEVSVICQVNKLCSVDDCVRLKERVLNFDQSLFSQNTVNSFLVKALNLTYHESLYFSCCFLYC